jgi:plastocyanin
MYQKVVSAVVMFVCIIVLSGIMCTAEEKGASQQAAPGTEEEVTISNRIVKINEREGASPSILVTALGTTVIWVNHSKSPLEVLFLDKKVTLACGSPVNFFVGKDGAYESGKIPFGSTASLCFTEKGKYDYIVKVSRTFYMPAQGGAGAEHRGSIVIE